MEKSAFRKRCYISNKKDNDEQSVETSMDTNSVDSDKDSPILDAGDDLINHIYNFCLDLIDKALQVVASLGTEDLREVLEKYADFVVPIRL